MNGLKIEFERVFFSGDAREQQIVSVPGESSVVSHKRKRLRRPDTNVLSVKFNQLLQPSKFDDWIIKFK